MPFESPIEAEMAKVLDELKISYQSQFEVGGPIFGNHCRGGFYCDYRADMGPDEEAVCMAQGDETEDGYCRYYVPPSKFSLYRLDFAVMIGQHRIAIECDGFDYHKRQPQQIEADAKRDRWLRENGWIVKHYSGTFITRHRNKVKQDIQELIASLTPNKEPEQKSLF